MSRFLLISFAALGLAFYELSGGEDFAPPERIAQEPRPQNQPASKRITLIPAEASRTRIVMEAKPMQARTVTQASTPVQRASAPAERPIISGMTLTSPSLGLAGIVNEPQQYEPIQVAQVTRDLREVRASRANLRMGPGTRYPVMGQLLAGTVIEVLDAERSDWVLMQDTQDGHIGWIAASLLSSERP